MPTPTGSPEIREPAQRAGSARSGRRQPRHAYPRSPFRRHRRVAPAWAALGLLAGLFGLLALLSPVAAQTATTLVSNATQGNETNWSGTDDRSQAFTTGATGATLSSVGIISQDLQGDAFAVSLCTVDASDRPTSSCTDLTPPSSFAAGTVVFTAPSNTTLNANTTYALLVTNTANVKLTVTPDDGEDVGSVSGWSIANTFDVKSASNVWSANFLGASLYITIKGTLSSSTNSAPTVATEIPNQTAMSGTAFSYQVPAATFADADGDTLTYTATLADDMALPSWLSFGPRHAHPLGHANGRGDRLGESDGERRQRLGQRHLRHRGLGGGDWHL